MTFYLLNKVTNFKRCNCYKNGKPLRNTNIPSLYRNPVFIQSKIQKGGRLQFRSLEINNFGRIKGSGGNSLNNFI